MTSKEQKDSEDKELSSEEKQGQKDSKNIKESSEDMKVEEWWAERDMTGKDGITAFIIGGVPPSKRKPENRSK